MENQPSLVELQLKHRAQSLFNGDIVPYSAAVSLLMETHETLSHLSYSDIAFERFLNEFSKLSNYLDALVKVEGIEETKHLKAYQVLIAGTKGTVLERTYRVPLPLYPESASNISNLKKAAINAFPPGEYLAELVIDKEVPIEEP